MEILMKKKSCPKCKGKGTIKVKRLFTQIYPKKVKVYRWCDEICPKCKRFGWI
jgi:hypothetical protein